MTYSMWGGLAKRNPPTSSLHRRVTPAAKPGLRPHRAPLIPPVESRFKKHFRSGPDPNHHYIRRRPASHEGRFAIVTDVGCGMRWTRRRRARVVMAGRVSRERSPGGRTTDACRGRRSRVVLTPRRWRQVQRRHVRPTGRTAPYPLDDGGKQARSPGRARSKPLKPFACGNAG